MRLIPAVNPAVVSPGRSNRAKLCCVMKGTAQTRIRRVPLSAGIDKHAVVLGTVQPPTEPDPPRPREPGEESHALSNMTLLSWLPPTTTVGAVSERRRSPSTASAWSSAPGRALSKRSPVWTMASGRKSEAIATRLSIAAIVIRLAVTGCPG